MVLFACSREIFRPHFQGVKNHEEIKYENPVPHKAEMIKVKEHRDHEEMKDRQVPNRLGLKVGESSLWLTGIKEKDSTEFTTMQGV